MCLTTCDYLMVLGPAVKVNKAKIVVEDSGSSSQMDKDKDRMIQARPFIKLLFFILQLKGKKQRKRSYCAVQKKEQNFAKQGGISESKENPPLYTLLHLRQQRWKKTCHGV